ncbi:unnamed protein product [Penicillium nalgiovense]|uniref:Uncharacterized protein n=2 Tax=Penicillium nalgiovense TaxID=60175 RepID=A0A9W4INJ3_PENNA|nr:unnamed protein product [Penicillium nalgiovense]CAG8232417.1 unnamed protein product [Penicillium nalgiovense]CAG8232741.1 unnamed protein product [Penicillium nalgiovense]CAG8234379.1 unnamed protein product [Penicillium nalgiovense]CAG8239979.1 unnamed protein product [Penicillium nalgiovense]
MLFYIMDPATSRQEKEEERAQLRSRYNEAVSGLLQALKSEPKAAYSSDNLTELGVVLALFNPESSSFLESKACLFKPISSEELEGFSLSRFDLPEGSQYWYNNFDNIYHYPTNVQNPSPAYIIGARTEQIFRYLRVYYTNLQKSGRDTDFFEEFDGWDGIREGNSLLDGGMGLLYGRCGGVPRWDIRTEREWQEDSNDPETTSPHIMLVACTTDDTTKADELLFSELGSITQAIRKRLDQKEFEKTSLFPICHQRFLPTVAISFFGPRHGRLLQANYTKSGILKVRVSPIYSFVHEAEAPFDLFLRYNACDPQDGSEYEFYSDKEDAPTQATEYVSPSTESEKENITAKEYDHTPSVEES